MKRSLLLIFICSVLGSTSSLSYGQSIYDSLWIHKASSIFHKIDTGKYSGNSDGNINIIYDSVKTLTLDFKSSAAELSIVQDRGQIYDNSTKRYFTSTTSGKTFLKYDTYALANFLTIVFNHEHYSVGSIDGACDTPMRGLTFNYRHENNTEYLTLTATESLELTTADHLVQSQDINYGEANKLAKSITLKKGSRIILRISK